MIGPRWAAELYGGPCDGQVVDVAAERVAATAPPPRTWNVPTPRRMGPLVDPRHPSAQVAPSLDVAEYVLERWEVGGGRARYVYNDLSSWPG